MTNPPLRRWAIDWRLALTALVSVAITVIALACAAHAFWQALAVD